jgi:hypothetical protein
MFWEKETLNRENIPYDQVTPILPSFIDSSDFFCLIWFMQDKGEKGFDLLLIGRYIWGQRIILIT